MGSKLIFIMVTFISVILLKTSLAQDIDDGALRARFMRLREIIMECNCPANCMLRLKMCLGSGECSSCKVPTYGKRAWMYPRQNLIPDYELY